MSRNVSSVSLMNLDIARYELHLSDAAPELQQIREQVRNVRMAPTTPIDVPVKESNMNGAVERALRSWEGHFQTVRDHLDGEIAAVDGRQIDATHPLWQWCAWWASSILDRYAVRPNGRTTCELITSHQTKLLVVSFGQHVLWRLPRKRSGAGKLDSEWHDGIFLGLGGTSSEAYIGSANGVKKANGFRLAADSPYSVDDLVNFNTSIREYVEGDTDSDAIAFPRTDPAGAYVPEPTAARRMRLHPMTSRSTVSSRIAQYALRLETARV